MIKLGLGRQSAIVAGGELVSYQVGGHEFMHSKGSPGWGHSDTEMFPVIGPTAEASYRVQVPRGNAIQDQHGLLRDMEYSLVRQTDSSVELKKSYTAGTRVENAKFPEKSTAQWLIWPFAFEFTKKVTLTEVGISIRFAIQGEKDMPYMLGYHPAFRLETKNPYVEAGGKKISLEEVLAVGSRALLVADTEEVVLHDLQSLRIKSKGFGNFMIWTEVPSMICVEPITFYPYAVAQRELHKGFDYLPEEGMSFDLTLSPNKL